MHFIHIRFGSSLSSALAHIRERHQRFRSLLADTPTGVRVTIRSKNPEFDLPSSYSRRLGQSAIGSAAFIFLSFFLYPENILTVGSRPPGSQTQVQIEYIPKTVQRARPPAAPRPVVPIAVDGEIVPEDVTIESTELDLDAVPIDLRLASAGNLGPPTDEPMMDTDIEFKPHPIRIVTPRYPSQAEKDKLEGVVVLRVLVDKAGRVEQAEVLHGPEIFREAALVAARQFRFRPGKHAGARRKVWMRMPITFKLN